MANNYLGDDIHHNGAFWLSHIFNFINWFGQPRPGPVEAYPAGLIDPGTSDGYTFFLQMGSLANADLKYFRNVNKLWDEWMEHGDYDYLTQFGSLVILNNGVEFAVTYLAMLAVLFCWGGGRYVSVDYWIRRRFMPSSP